ncbi:YcxB family protein [Streptomyces sp. NPDC026673]|uniref:YcxB family protein n=1 Tax=Streptomyces sp. NPDC026673 TaxID=3155724 RepID=UPI0034105ED7
MTNDMRAPDPGAVEQPARSPAGAASDDVPAVEFTWTPSRDDVAEVLRAQRRRLEFWRLPLVFAVGTVALIAALRVLMPGFTETGDEFVIALSGGVTVVTGLAGGAIDRWRGLRKVTAHARSQGEYTVRVADEGVHFASAFSDHKMPWTSFSHYAETPRLFLLVHDTGMNTMSMLPKRGAGGGPDMEGLRAIVERHLAPRPRAVSGDRREGARPGRRG